MKEFFRMVLEVIVAAFMKSRKEKNEDDKIAKEIPSHKDRVDKLRTKLNDRLHK